MTQLSVWKIVFVIVSLLFVALDYKDIAAFEYVSLAELVVGFVLVLGAIKNSKVLMRVASIYAGFLIASYLVLLVFVFMGGNEELIDFPFLLAILCVLLMLIASLKILLYLPND